MTSPGPPKYPPTPKSRYGDRFIPSRAGNAWHLAYPCSPSSALEDDGGGGGASTPSKKAKMEKSKGGRSRVYGFLLRNEVLGTDNNGDKDYSSGTKRKLSVCRKLFHYDLTERPSAVINQPWSPYSLSPISKKSANLLQSPRPLLQSRIIPKAAVKVLDAPDLVDDFYLNLLDWSAENVIGVGLETSVYLWSAETLEVGKLCDLATSNEGLVYSVSWNEKGDLIAVGTKRGGVNVWDITAGKLVTKLKGHTDHVGSLAWNGQNVVASGSWDTFINQNDIRVPPRGPQRQLSGHSSGVCGLKWAPDNQMLASGGGDNRVYLWDARATKPVQCYKEHSAAVKALAWSPHRHGILATGGGTTDTTIRFYNTLTGLPDRKECLVTGSQVCNLAWSKSEEEFVSTHGFQKNEISIWKYPSLQSVAKLQGHTHRVVYMAMCPTGEGIVTGSGDETLRFWHIFERRYKMKNKSELNLHTALR